MVASVCAVVQFLERVKMLSYSQKKKKKRETTGEIRSKGQRLRGQARKVESFDLNSLVRFVQTVNLLFVKSSTDLF